MQDEKGKTTHFGFQTVPESEKAAKVQKVFASVASKYDVMNDVMSFGIHRIWKESMMDWLAPKPGQKLIDVAGGTGDIARKFVKNGGGSAYIIDVNIEMIKAGLNQKENQKKLFWTAASAENIPLRDISFRFLSRAGAGHATVLDLTEDMLATGKKRAESTATKGSIDWVVGDALALPFADNFFDVYTISFGIRNVTHPYEALTEAYRVLRPGGRLMVLEFNKIPIPLAQKAYDLYSFNIIPKMGEIITGDRESYQYLIESIRKFPDQETFLDLLKKAKFENTSYRNLTLGIAAIHSGWKL